MVTKMPPFVIRTPQVALVAVAGSDFGVLIERPGVTFASVFRHRVNLQTPDVLSGTVWTLGENDSVELQATQGDQPLITVYPAQPAQFARDLPKEKPLYSIEVHRAKEKPGRSGRWSAPSLLVTVYAGDSQKEQTVRRVRPSAERKTTHEWSLAALVSDPRRSGAVGLRVLF